MKSLVRLDGRVWNHAATEPIKGLFHNLSFQLVAVSAGPNEPAAITKPAAGKTQRVARMVPLRRHAHQKAEKQTSDRASRSRATPGGEGVPTRVRRCARKKSKAVAITGEEEAKQAFTAMINFTSH